MKPFDIGILVYSTDFSYGTSRHFLNVAIDHARRLDALAQKTYVLTIDAEDYSKRIGAEHRPLAVPDAKYVKHAAFLQKATAEIRKLLDAHQGRKILLVGRNLIAGALVARAARRRPDVRAAVYFQYDWVTWKGREGNPLDHLVAKLCRGIVVRDAGLIIATTPTLRRQLVDAGAAPEKVAVIPNHVDVKTFHPRPKSACRKALGMPEDERNALFVGRLVQQKNLPNLLQAVADVPGLVLYLAGSGPLKEELEQKAAELGIRARVRFLGPVLQDRLAVYLNACDAFVLPSWYEGNPKVLLEAMASGCAIVASDAEGNRDTARDGRNALTFEPSDAAALAGALRKMLKNAALRRRLSGQAFLDSKPFAIQNVMKKEMNAFRRLAKGVP